MGKRIISRKILALLMCLMLLVGALPANAVVAPVSREALEAIVRAKVDSLTLSGSGVDGIIDRINASITDTVTKAVVGVTSPDNLKKIAVPLISSGIKTALAGYGINLPDGIDIDKTVEEIVGNELVDSFLSSDIVKEIIARTVEYAVADIMKDVKIPTAGEIMAAQKEELIQKLTDAIFAAPLVKVDVINSDLNAPVVKSFLPAGTYKANTSLYDYTIDTYNKMPFVGTKISAKSITITGWNENNIGTYIDWKYLLISLSGVSAPDLSNIDYQDVVLKALQRAAKDVITEKIEEAKAKIKEAIEDAIVKAKADAAIKINELFSEVGIDVEILPDDTKEQIEEKLKNALKELSEEKKAELLQKLSELKQDVKVKYVPMAIALIDRVMACLDALKPEFDVALTGINEILIPRAGEIAASETYLSGGKFKLVGCPEWKEDPCVKPVITFTGELAGVTYDSATGSVFVAAGATEGKFVVTATYDPKGCFKPLSKTLEVNVVAQKALPDEVKELLTVTKSASDTNINIGGIVTYTVTIKNNSSEQLYIYVEDVMNDVLQWRSEDIINPGDLGMLTKTYTKTFSEVGVYKNVVTASTFNNAATSQALLGSANPNLNYSSSADETVTVTNNNVQRQQEYIAPNVALTVGVEGPGVATPGTGAYSQNSVVQFTVTPEAGAEFIGWFGPNGTEIVDNRITMNEAKSVTARFAVPVIEDSKQPESAPAPTPAPKDTGTDEVVIDQAVPNAAPSLPKTAGLPMEILLAAGAFLAAAGSAMRKKK